MKVHILSYTRKHMVNITKVSLLLIIKKHMKDHILEHTQKHM